MISEDAGVLNIQFPFSFPISNNKKGHPLLRLSVSKEAILLRSYLQFPSEEGGGEEEEEEGGGGGRDGKGKRRKKRQKLHHINWILSFLEHVLNRCYVARA